MKKKGKLTIGGLQGKIFRLCITLVIAATAVFTALGMLQLNTLEKMASDTAKSEAKRVKNQSEASMMQMTEESMKNLASQAAENTDWEIWEISNEAVILAEQVRDIFEHPENYGRHRIELPDKANDGKLTLQLLMAEDVRPSGADMEMVYKLANLEALMRTMIEENEYDTQDLIIALPNGLSLDMDMFSERKFNEDGSIRPYDARIRPWWKEAVKRKDAVLTHAVHSQLLKVSELVFGVPVYVDGELAAVVESSVRLDVFHEIVSKTSYGRGGFSIVVSDDRKLVFSPFDEGELKMDNMLSTDMRETGNEQLDAILDKALTGEVGFDKVTIDGTECFVAYAPLTTVNWTQMMFVNKEELEKPTGMLLKQMDRTTRQAYGEYKKRFRYSSMLMLFVMVLLVASTFFVAWMFSNRLTVPIDRMTERVRAITGDDFSFEMEDVYHTGDEIEVLAETFGELSEKTRQYIREITDITAEKERIGAELSVATRIQANMLPSDFPLFPEKKEFTLFATMMPAKEVGGDFYDAFLLDEDHLCMVMGDVSDKGVPAALFMVNAKTMLKNRAKIGGTPAEILYDVNNSLCEGNKEMMFVTVWMGILTISTGTVIEANAGHDYPVLRRGGGDYEIYEQSNGFVLGGMKEMDYEDDTFTLASGDELFIYTDGLPEATNAEGNQLEIEGMLKALNAHKNASASELLEQLTKEVDRFVGNAPQFDDLTMLSLRYLGKS